MLLKFVLRKTTITKYSYVNVMTTFRELTKEKRCANLPSNILLVHHNAPMHMPLKVSFAIRVSGFQQFNNPPCNQDLTVPDFILTIHLKEKSEAVVFRGTKKFGDSMVCRAAQIYTSKGDNVVAGKMIKVYRSSRGLHWKKYIHSSDHIFSYLGRYNIEFSSYVLV